MSLFNETEYFADPNAKEPELVEVEKYLRKRKLPFRKSVPDV